MGQNIFLMGNYRGYSDVIPLSVGYEECEPGHSFGPYIKNNASFHYILSGKGVFSGRGREYTLGKGDCFTICGGEKVRYAADADDPWQYIWIAFGGTMSVRLENLECPVFSYPYDTFIRLIGWLQSCHSGRSDATASAIFEILSFIDSGVPQKIDYVQTVKNCVCDHYQEGITVEDIAGTVGLNRHYLTSIFRDATGETVIGYLSRVRLENAKRLLEEGYSVGEVALMVGYSDQFHFSKMFKRRYGISPSGVKNEK